MEKQTVIKESGGGISFMSMLFLLFLTLKLTGTIDWSWLWVTAPLWLPLAIAFILIVGAAFLCFIVNGIETIIEETKE